MRIVTTHLGADFDALGAAMGATLLDPEARVVFPGSQEAAVRRFVEAEGIAIPEIRIRELRRATITAATVVDCASLRRLGEVGELITAAACPVRVIDHHPEDADPIPGASVITADVAATCTVVTDELRRLGLRPDSTVASLLLLGIYEDTGGLTYADTTPDDIAAAAWLLERGARLDWVRRYVLRPLEPEQLQLLNRLVEGATEHRVAGVPVVISVVNAADLVEEASYVVHRYAEIFSMPVTIAMLEAPPQLIVIARSTHPQVDAGQLLARFGGGGHATAAACRVRGASSVELGEKLLDRIRRMLRVSATAGAMASAGLHSCDAAATVAEAKSRMVRLRVNALPVARSGVLVGLVTRQVLDSAVAQGFADRPVTAVMSPEVAVVRSSTPLEEVEHALLEPGRRLVVVEREDGSRGVITRMDILRRLYQRQLREGGRVDRRIAGAKPVVHRVASRLRRVLSERVVTVLADAGAMAEELGMRAFLVGGAVRDLLLDRPMEDLDLVVEGNGIELARRLVERLGGRYHPHDPFLTAAVHLAGDVRLDVATARTEFYRSPAALPEVETSAIRQDLYRRDFTINAMAVNLAPGAFGELLDYFGGWRDLEGRQVRVLHSLSFIDDPTRVIRAARFATRLSFEIAPETAQLIRVAVQEGVFTRLSSERLRDELVLLLEEENVSEALFGLQRLTALEAILPELRWTQGLRRLLHRLESILTWSRLEGVYRQRQWTPYVVALATRLAEDAAGRAARRLALTGAAARQVAGARAGCERILAVVSRTAVRPSEVVEVLERSAESWRLVAMAYAAEPEQRVIRTALTEWMSLGPGISGADLVAAGVPPGPAVGEALRRLRADILDGRVDSAAALAHAVGIARSLGKGAS